MALFTIILDYNGGTYVAQVKARNPRQACLKWAAQIKPIDIADLGEAGKVELQTALNDEKPVPLAGLMNVWCMTASVRRSLALINIVQTEVL